MCHLNLGVEAGTFEDDTGRREWLTHPSCPRTTRFCELEDSNEGKTKG